LLTELRELGKCESDWVIESRSLRRNSAQNGINGRALEAREGAQIETSALEMVPIRLHLLHRAAAGILQRYTILAQEISFHLLHFFHRRGILWLF
jgi:hypothetical protein